MVNMSQDDFGDDWVRPIEQDEDFYSDEMGNILHSVSAAEREKVTCYYKSFRGKPDPEFDERCAACDGYPIVQGCTKYTTKEHIDSFYKKHGIVNPNQPIKPVPTGLDDLEQFGGLNAGRTPVQDSDRREPPKTLDNIDSWQGPSTFGN
jgi:hypothetical protein